MKTGPAVKHRIHDDALAAAHHFTHHLVAHDERIPRRDRAFVNLQVCPAKSAVRDADQNMTVGEFWPCDVVERQVARGTEDHRLHAGSGFPRVSVPNGSSRSPTTNAND